jgi:ferrous iron transport protein A
VLEDLRLKEMGLRPGERIRVIQKAGIGGRVIALGCARIAVDSATARAIEVEVAG